MCLAVVAKRQVNDCLVVAVWAEQHRAMIVLQWPAWHCQTAVVHRCMVPKLHSMMDRVHLTMVQQHRQMTGRQHQAALVLGILLIPTLHLGEYLFAPGHVWVVLGPGHSSKLTQLNGLGGKMAGPSRSKVSWCTSDRITARKHWPVLVFPTNLYDISSFTNGQVGSSWFLQRVSIPCYAKRCISHCKSVWPSVT